MEQSTKLSFKGQSIYIGIDTHKQSWRVSLYSDKYELKTMTMPPHVGPLGDYLEKMYPEANYYSVYEAGFCGYWVHQKLEERGIKNMIVNPADVPTKDKEKKRKTDPVDSRKLARSLRSGDLEGIYIRTDSEIQHRMLVRSRHDIVRKQTRCKNQIKAVLNFFGIILTDEKIRTHWSKKYIQWVRGLCTDESGESVRLRILLNELEYHRQTISDLTKLIRKLSELPEHKISVENLSSVTGIGLIGAMTILTELGDLKTYNRIDKLCSYIGLISDEHTSGEKESKTGITKRGNSYLRKVLLEASWTAIRKDPVLQLAYRKYCSRTTPTKAIIKIARKLLNRIRYVLINEKKYELLYQ